MRTLLTITLLLFIYCIRLFPLSLNNENQNQATIYRFIALDYPVQKGRIYTYSIGHTVIIWDHYPQFNLKDHIEVRGVIQTNSVFGIKTSQTLKEEKTTTLKPTSLNLGEHLVACLSDLRSNLTAALSQALPEPESSLAAGILLGVKREMSEEFKTSLIRSGTLHTVAASGYNVSLVSRYILNVTSFLPRQLSFLLAGLGILVFCLLAGSSAAVIRAGVMATLILIGAGIGRQKDALRLLFVASYLMLIIDPLYLFDVGFQLSVAATFGILYFEPLLSAKLQLTGFLTPVNKLLKDYFHPTLAATILTLPITYLTFGEFSLIGLLANPLVLPLIPLIMALTTAFLIITMVVPPLSSFFALVLYLPLTYYKLVVNFFGSI